MHRSACGDKSYWIEIDQVFEETERNGIAYYNLPIHLAEKEWVAIPLFFEVFVSALRYQAKRTGTPIDESMLARMKEEGAKDPQPELHIRGDKDVRYERVAQAMAAAQQAGVRKIGFVTDPKQ